MKGFALLIGVVAGLLLETGEAVKCFECTDIPDPKYCRHTQTCGTDETCSIEQVVNAHGDISFNMGCLKNTICQAVGSTKKRNIDGVTMCVLCCDNDFCNVEGCGKQLAAPGLRGPLCLTCDSVSSPDMCNSVHQCADTERCLISDTGSHYRLACESSAVCATMTSNDCSGSGSCCSDDYCNAQCGNGTTSHTTGSSRCDTSGGYTEVEDVTGTAKLCVHIHNDHTRTWDDARAQCVSEGADLLVLDSYKKAVLMRDTLSSYTHLSYWLGMRDFDSTDTYRWVNNQPVVTSESDWHHGQPNHYDAHHIQDCGIMYDGVGSHHKWHDDNCERSYNYICERT